MKGIVVIADGLGGRPTDFEGKTCLQAADTPNLDELAAGGLTGLLDPIKPGVRPGSDTAHLSIFGYDPQKFYTGRGVFEALGIGMEVKRGDVSFRTNFATVDDNMLVKDRRAGRIQESQEELEQALQELNDRIPEAEIFFKVSTEHRGALILRGTGLSGDIADVDPHQVGVKVPAAKPLTEEASKTAKLLDKIVKESYLILKGLPLNKKRIREGKLPANIILPRGAAIRPELPSLRDLHGVEGIMTGAGALYIGVAKAIGLKYKRAQGVTGGADSPIINKAKLAIEELKNTDFIFIHIKGADSCGHDHHAEGKIKFIEKIDDTMGYLMENLEWEETHLTFTGDHSTPIVYGDHVSDPLPILFCGPNVLPDKVKQFDESSVYQGGLGRISGQVAPILFGYNNWLSKFGA